MDNQLKELFGAWIQATGTVTTAIGSTPSRTLSDEVRESLIIWGNALQAAGNALIADAQETFSLEKLGNGVQAIGNSAVIAGIVIDFNEEIKKRLDINGNWLQAFGGTIALPEDLVAEPSTIRTLNIAGNILQITGNSMQAIGGTRELKQILLENNDRYKGYKESNQKDEQEQDKTLEINGSWIQAVGSVISAIAQTKENVMGQS